MGVKTKHEKRKRRHLRVRRRVVGTPERPRLSVFRSQKHIYAQVIDDTAQRTLVAASSVEPSFREDKVSGADVEGAARVGKLLAERAIQKGLKKVVFDRGGYLYHGRIKALAEAAREGGLDF
ncbi:MAG: 50S ribosomal protein L18 [Bacillota bacterium]|jgi:large subunit ribosomal protein L18|nr:50S ribosomal protein L18 [Candidatus Fermentithermobacillaceae bacterium]